MSSDSPVQSSVIARPKSDFYGFIILLAICGIIVAGAGFFAWHGSARHSLQDLWIGLVAIFSLFFVPCIYMLWLMCHLRLTADAHGLQIRGAFQTRLILWRDIEDYELRAAPQAATARLCWICANGKWQRLPQILANMEAMRTRIQTESQWSRAREWQLNVERDDAQIWPKTYAYRDPSGAKMFGWVAVGLLFICLLLATDSFGSSTAKANFSDDALEKWLHIAALFLPLLLAHYAIFRAKKRQNAPTIRADQNTLSLADTQSPTRIAWDKITDYFIEDPKKGMTLPQYVIEGAGERLFFQRGITDFGELQSLVCARAVNAASSEWRHRESTDADTLGGADSLWSGGVAGVGRKVYHYRTRTLRALLILGAVMISVFAIGSALSLHRQSGETDGLMLGFVLLTPIAAATIAGALAFWRGSIQTDENGVTQRGIWGERTLRWSAIESFAFNGHFYVLKGQNTTLRYWLVAAEQNLRAEIETRAGLKMRRTDRSVDDE